MRLLFEAYRDNNNELFVQTAQLIIGRELSSNHHEVAQQLIRSLGITKDRQIERRRLTRLPQQSPTGADAILVEYPRDTETPVLAQPCWRLVERLITEQNSRNALLAHKLQPVSRILFWGPPGNGKTLTARYVASQLGLAIATSNLSGIISSLLGATAAQLRQVFAVAMAQNVVLFLDEFDALGKERNDELEIGEPKRIVNSLLQNLDAFDREREGTRSLLIAATNHQYLLDSAVWRRFDMLVHFPMPGTKERQILLKRLLSGVRVSGSVTDAVANSVRMSYADITIAVQESLKTMVLSKRKSLSAADIVQAIFDRKKNLADALKAQRAARIDE
jgi:SpoVK/Ycf46/Vps4 family AAA+-type ATPase